MNKKLVVSALVLGFSFAPISAFADSLTTIQGGSPTYSCPQGSTLIDTNKCESPSTTYPATQQTTQQYVHIDSGHVSPDDTWAYYYQFQNPNCKNYGGDTGWGWSSGWADCLRDVTTFTCPDGGQSDGLGSCVLPSTTFNATISGSNGGSLVASVTGFLSPVWNFITDRLLPAIGLLVVLGIGVRLSIKAVRKYSKVA